MIQSNLSSILHFLYVFFDDCKTSRAPLADALQTRTSRLIFGCWLEELAGQGELRRWIQWGKPRVRTRHLESLHQTTRANEYLLLLRGMFSLKYLVRTGSKYCLEFSIARGRLNFLHDRCLHAQSLPNFLRSLPNFLRFSEGYFFTFRSSG